MKDFDVEIRLVSLMAESHDSAYELIKPAIKLLNEHGTVSIKLKEQGEWL